MLLVFVIPAETSIRIHTCHCEEDVLIRRGNLNSKYRLLRFARNDNKKTESRYKKRTPSRRINARLGVQNERLTSDLPLAVDLGDQHHWLLTSNLPGQEFHFPLPLFSGRKLLKGADLASTHADLVDDGRTREG